MEVDGEGGKFREGLGSGMRGGDWGVGGAGCKGWGLGSLGGGGAGIEASGRKGPRKKATGKGVEGGT